MRPCLYPALKVIFRAVMILVPSLFTVKTILMIAFILKFETMSCKFQSCLRLVMVSFTNLLLENLMLAFFHCLHSPLCTNGTKTCLLTSFNHVLLSIPNPYCSQVENLTLVVSIFTILCNWPHRIRTLPRGGMYFPMHPDSRQCTSILSALAGKYWFCRVFFIWNLKDIPHSASACIEWALHQPKLL